MSLIPSYLEKLLPRTCRPGIYCSSGTLYQTEIRRGATARLYKLPLTEGRCAKVSTLDLPTRSKYSSAGPPISFELQHGHTRWYPQASSQYCHGATALSTGPRSDTQRRDFARAAAEILRYAGEPRADGGGTLQSRYIVGNGVLDLRPAVCRHRSSEHCNVCPFSFKKYKVSVVSTPPLALSRSVKLCQACSWLVELGHMSIFRWISPVGRRKTVIARYRNQSAVDNRGASLHVCLP